MRLTQNLLGWGRRTLVAAVAMALLASATPAQQATTGETQGQGFPPPPKPLALSAEGQAQWNAVGRINVAGYSERSSCTGVLIAPSRVLTAAHCLNVPGSSRSARPTDIVFVAGWRNGEWVADRRGARVERHPEQRKINQRDPLTFGADLAVLHLTAPIEADLAEPMNLARFPDGQQGGIAVIGYPTSRGQVLNWLGPCRVYAVEVPVIGMDCEMEPGFSGAPVLYRAPGDETWQVVAVVVANIGHEVMNSLAARPDNWLPLDE